MLNLVDDLFGSFSSSSFLILFSFYRSKNIIFVFLLHGISEPLVMQLNLNYATQPRTKSFLPLRYFSVSLFLD